MDRLIVLLRGVNIGKRRLPMATLRDGMTEAGCTDVVTYVQSGNLVLVPPALGGAPVAPWLEATISTIAGFDVPVVTRSAADLARIVEANPYPEAGGTNLHVIFYASSPARVIDQLEVAAFAPEHCTLIGDDLYLYLPKGMGRATLPPALEKVARRKPPLLGTARNWNTVLELVRLSTAD